MPTVRHLLHDVDALLPFYRALGFRLTHRRAPPFAVVKRNGLALWLSGPGISAAKKLKDGSLPQPGGWNRLVIEVASLDDQTRSDRRALSQQTDPGTRGPLECGKNWPVRDVLANWRWPPSVEEVLVELLDVDNFFDPATDVESDHQAGEKRPIDQYDALAQHVGRFLCCRREGRRREEQALVRFEPIQRPEEVPDLA